MSILTASTESRSIAQLLQDHTVQDAKSTIIIACCKKSFFLNQLLHSISLEFEASRREEETNPLDEDMLLDNDTTSPGYGGEAEIALLTPTLRLLSVSEKTILVFCPSIPTFRAYLAAFPHTKQGHGGSIAQVIVLNMITLHHGTSEFTVQGLSRSLALLSSTAGQIGTSVRLMECIDVKDPTSPYAGSRLWNAEIPLLSGSIKIGEAGQGWAQRTIVVRKVAERWIKFD